MHNKSKNSAFTLVELAIVIVIISLITAGVLGGQKLIETSNKNAVINEYVKYSDAFQAFNLEYQGWPGDLSNAQSYFGGGVENGNGNGSYTSYTESFYAWEHLAQAGIIQGEFIGEDNAGGDNVVDPGIDAPASEYNKTPVNWIPFSIQYSSHGWSAYDLYDPKFNFLYLTANSASGADWQTGVKCNDAHYIDKKIDDELPYSGKVTLWGGTCHLGSIEAAAEYRKTPHENKTHMRFLLSKS